MQNVAGVYRGISGYPTEIALFYLLTTTFLLE